MIDWVQGQTQAGNAAAQHTAVMFGDCFVPGGWAFGDVVQMVDGAMSVPGMAADTVRQSQMANSVVEN